MPLCQYQTLNRTLEKLLWAASITFLVKCTMARMMIEILVLCCRPVGKVKISIKASWMKDAKVDMDALTEMSFGRSEGGAASSLQGDNEQVSGRHQWGLMLDVIMTS
jgi:hypothetical protein